MSPRLPKCGWSARALPDAVLCFMHPVKPKPAAIAEAYHVHGVRTFSLDSHEELAKIVEACTSDDRYCRQRPAAVRAAAGFVRIFRAEPRVEVRDRLGRCRPLLQATRQVADWLGVCFHVGSQAMTPFAYVQALERVRAAIVDAAVTVDIVDVGGGFPSIYPGMEPPPLEDYFGAIHRAFESLPVSYSSELWCEPGRALCAEYNSLIVRVEKGRGEELYINDGAYGALYDAAHVGWRFPVKCLSEGRSEVLAPFCILRPDL
jgi:ornithine decarboxylase